MTTNIKWPPLNSVGNVSITNSNSGIGTMFNSAYSGLTLNDGSLRPTAIHVNGDAVFKGNIEWQGRDMREWFASVESRLAMLHPNPELEQDWEQLQQLRMQYVELERKLLEKQRTFDILKKP
jgi:hypothetical protein